MTQLTGSGTTSSVSHAVHEAPPAPEYAIEAFRLTRRFQSGRGVEITAVDRLDLRVPRGYIFGLVGPDGAGKTTTIRMLCGIIPPSEGTARIVGYDVTRQVGHVHRHTGYMSQRFTLYEDLTVEENIRFFASIFGIPTRQREARMAELLAFAGLESFRRRRAAHLSGGMKQKLALACTLIHEPEVLLLDEPTTGVDPVARRDLWRILYALVGRGVTILVSTPYMDEAERCNMVAFLYAGRLLAVGTPDELKRRLRWQVLSVRARPLEAARHVAGEVPGIVDVQIMGDTLHLFVEDAEAVMPALRRALEGEEIEVRTLRRVVPSMEDVFMALMADKEGTR
ncbi:MAG TPA: ABC transporter ATP-binding protein [Caldilineae bacterium]|jgi:ABC-2 type transport system ATP-binding protein|nr:ABC transporter ATP-binding protein [Caldilineae bacterium]